MRAMILIWKRWRRRAMRRRQVRLLTSLGRCDGHRLARFECEDHHS